MQRLLISVSDWLECQLSHPVGFSVYWALCGLCTYLWGWDGLDRYLTCTGGGILVLLLGAGRRDTKAVHARLDHLTSDWPNRLEEKTEEEIEELRDD